MNDDYEKKMAELVAMHDAANAEPIVTVAEGEIPPGDALPRGVGEIDGVSFTVEGKPVYVDLVSMTCVQKPTHVPKLGPGEYRASFTMTLTGKDAENFTRFVEDRFRRR